MSFRRRRSLSLGYAGTWPIDASVGSGQLWAAPISTVSIVGFLLFLAARAIRIRSVCSDGKMRKEAQQTIGLPIRYSLYRAAGLRGTSHSGRRTFEASLFRKGATIEQVQLLFGHESIDDTSRYIDDRIEDFRAAIAAVVRSKTQGPVCYNIVLTHLTMRHNIVITEVI